MWTERDAARFWSKVDQSGECWLWTGNRPGGRYGYLLFDGKQRLAHRLIYEVTHGPLGPGEVVMHACDNPACVRSEHLVKGTQKLNVRDMNAKGRAPDRRGTLNGRSKLTEDGVREIRRRAAENRPLLAQEFGISNAMVNRIIRGEAWRHVA